MAWIKRNLIFVIILAVGLLGTGYCGYLVHSAIDANVSIKSDYDTAQQQLTTLQQANPPASPENIEAAKADQARMQTFLADFKKAFEPFPSARTNLDERAFADHLQLTLKKWALQATNAGVEIAPDYAFSFSQQKGKMNYSPDCVPGWMQEMEDIQVILRIIFNAKVNYFESIQRVPACEDEGGSADVLQTGIVSNKWGTISPYKVTFRGFSTELANVLGAFADSTNCFIVKYVAVSPSRVPLPSVQETAPQQYQQTFMAPQESDNSFDDGGEGGGRRRRYGRQRQQPQAIVIEQPAGPTPPQTILQETPLYITVVVDAVNLKK